MNLQKHHRSRGGEYSYTVLLEFEELRDDSELEKPIGGVLQVDLSDEFPFPVEVSIKDKMKAGSNKNASYVEMESQHQELEDSSQSPAEFQFTTNPVPEPTGGGKVYSIKTADYDPDTKLGPKEYPEFIEHHIKIPSAQEVRRIPKIMSAIIDGEASRDTLRELAELYNMDVDSAAEKFYKKYIKKYADFESEVKMQNFLIENTNMYRSYSDTIDKVENQITEEDLRHRTQSIQDVEEMIEVVNSQKKFPTINKKDVFAEVAEGSNKTELEEIADRLGIDDWSVVLSN
jgi:hypothetical protein